jgi:3-oxoacyl-[acyl-carrier protein] reductase
MRLEGKVAFVTGGSSGIGAAIARRLANDGAAVALTYSNNRSGAEEVVRDINRQGRAIALPLDLSIAIELTSTFDRIIRELGSVDIVVANAGDVMAKPIAESTFEDFDKAFAVNTRGTLLTFAEAARRVSDGGRIVGLSSILTRQARAGMGLYAAGKAAVEQFVRALAHELGPKGITANAVSPGPTDTGMLLPARREQAPKQTPLGRIGAPRDVADVVAFLASEDARWITGQVISVNGGMA